MSATLPPAGRPGRSVPPDAVTIPPLSTGAASHPGQVRSHNEDGVLARPEAGLWAVTDGMGGHYGGAEAAAAVIAALSAPGAVPAGGALDAALDTGDGALDAALDTGDGALERALDAVAAAIEGAGRAIAARAAEVPGAVIGATVVALVVRHGRWGCLWAGDSRVYRLHHGALAQLTRDHTEANDLLDAGVISAAEAASWPRANVISRAVGVSAPLVLDRVTGALDPGDVFVLCSDGLTKHVTDDEIAAAVRAHGAEAATAALIELTLARGARDNVTVAVVAAPPSAPGAPEGQA
ncbi:MAG: serine/threonine-protein phosphatase [Rhodobacteraceae bacterium]|nr:serine/threonine-protein phosphatase [Paracoccaceae bacterium]